MECRHFKVLNLDVSISCILCRNMQVGKRCRFYTVMGERDSQVRSDRFTPVGWVT